MNFERDIRERATKKIKEAGRTAPPKRVEDSFYKKESEITRKFIEGEYDLEKLERVLGELPQLGGIAVFETLPEFIQAVRQLGLKKEVQDEILDHENAHALEVLKRGYSIKYKIHFSRDKLRLLFLTVTLPRTRATTLVDNFNKNGRKTEEEELRDDLIAILHAPETLTNGTLSDLDRASLGNVQKNNKYEGPFH